MTTLPDYSLIYPDVGVTAEDVRIEHVSPDAAGRTVCVFGVLDTAAGREIRDGMLAWLLPEYDVWTVTQREPGTLFEYPALRFAQWLTTDRSLDCLLYVHTKGARFRSPIQQRVCQLWQREFTAPRSTAYITALQDGADAACPLTGPQQQTWYNGMFVSARALRYLPIITPQKDRFVFQRLFTGRDVCGLLAEHVSPDVLTDTLLILTASQDTLSSARPCPADYSVPVVWTRKLRKR